VEGPIVQLSPGQVALFGYGSLISMRSVERTLGRRYDGPYITCALRGWRRAWDIAMPNSTFYAETNSGRMYPHSILYLNVRREPGRLLNGVLFRVDAPELADFDRRESIYDRVDVTADLERLQVAGGPAYVYVGRPQYRLEEAPAPEIAAVRATYLAILEDGFAAHGPEFRAEYEASSDPVPSRLIIADKP
jgi:cation transport regulator ChaC